MLSQKIEAEVDSPGAVNSGVVLAEGFWAAGLGGLCHMHMPETHSPACRGYLASVAPDKKKAFHDSMLHVLLAQMRPLHAMHTLLCV